MAPNSKDPRKARPISRAIVEICFIVFLFYSNLLMGEFTKTNGQGKSLTFALNDIFSTTNFTIAVAAALLCAAALAQDTRVILLGTGNPNPEPDRMGPAAAVVSGDRVYIVDCGAGIVRRAAQAGIEMKQLTRAATRLRTREV